MPIKTTRILTTSDLSPDGVRIIIPWEDMLEDCSVFIPCINTRLAEAQINKLFLAWEREYLAQVRIEDKRMGLRVWRTM